MADTIAPINAAHEVLIASAESLCADTIAARGKLTKKATTAQLKELSRAGLIEMLPGKGGVPYYGLTQTSTPVVPDKPGVSATTPDAQGEAGFTLFTAQACARPENAPVEVVGAADTGGDGYDAHTAREMISYMGKALDTIEPIARAYMVDDQLIQDGVTTMDMLIDAQADHIKALDYFVNQHDSTRRILKHICHRDDRLDLDVMPTIEIATAVLALITNADALTDKLQHLLDSSRHECEGLRAELATYVNGKNEVAAGKKPTGYIVRTWGKNEPITKRFTKEKNAGQAATKLVRDGTTRAAFVFALVHAGTAEHKAAYVEAK